MMLFEIQIGVGMKFSGLLYVRINRFNHHFLVRYNHWQWGYSKDWYDGPYKSFGLGPLYLVCWNSNE